MDKCTSGDDSDSIDWNTDDELEIQGETAVSSSLAVPTSGGEGSSVNGEASSSAGSSRSNLVNHFVGMGFSEKLVLKAMEENGEGDTETILNALLTYSTLEESPPQWPCINPDLVSSDYEENLSEDLSVIDGWSEEETEDNSLQSDEHKMLLSLERMGSLSEKEQMLLSLVQMGYTFQESQIAMERCGPDASIAELTDFICAAQLSREADIDLPEDYIKPRVNGVSKLKKRKLFEISKKKNDPESDAIRLPNPMIGYGVPSMQPDSISRSLPDDATGPPFFYYENVALAPKGVWDKISRHLYDIEPEFVDSKYFCAAARKRGYVHNLPVENRFPLIPQPPLTVQQAFPLSRRWWPSWDPRDKLNCIQTAIASAKLTERIRSALEGYEGDPPINVQKAILDECRKWNLVWVGRNKVAPLEPDEVEMLLGFPKNHTRGGGISRTDRYKSLGNSFQVDTVAYHLSVLKDMYPNGINMLSLFSGIGGAEVALHRLGIKLKNVVSVEKSKVNRDIVRSWWEQTNQVGTLIDFDDVQVLDMDRLREVTSYVGGFDLIVGGSPCNNLAGSNRVSRDGLEGKESSLFYHYVRILGDVRTIMSGRQV